MVNLLLANIFFISPRLFDKFFTFVQANFSRLLIRTFK